MSEGAGVGWRDVRAWVALGILVALALGARSWHVERAALGHYDEGVYAISARAIASEGDEALFPGQVKFSPPVWFTSVAVVARVTGAESGASAIRLNIVVSTLTVLAAGMVGWAWFGPAAGVAGAALLAGSQFQVMLARTALTDPMFTLLMLLALAVLGHGLADHRKRWTILGGVLTGLAWNTKYHGWFVLAITAGAIGLAWLLHRRNREGNAWAWGALRHWCVATVLAGATYLPWALYMRTGTAGAGGWRSIFEYYLGMIGSEWGGNALRHLQMQWFLEGSLSRASVMLAAAAAVWVTRRPTRPGAMGVLAVGLGAIVWWWGSLGALVLLATIGLVTIARRPPSVGALILVGWIALWLVAAPVYHPYARLLLPLGVAGCLLAGLGMGALIGRLPGPPPGGKGLTPGRGTMALAGAALLMLVAGTRLLEPAGNPWRDGMGTVRAADAVSAIVPDGAPIVVIGEPSLAYYLLERGREVRELSEPIGVVEAMAGEAYLVAGVYAARAPTLREGLERLAPRLVELARFDLAPADLRLLDDLRPSQARAYRRAPDRTFDVRLFRMLPAAGSLAP